LASGQEVSIGSLARKINQITDNPTPAINLPKRDWDTSGKRFGCTEKSKNELGFEAVVSIDEGLEKTVAWTLENIDLILSTMNKHKAHFNEEEQRLFQKQPTLLKHLS